MTMSPTNAAIFIDELSEYFTLSHSVLAVEKMMKDVDISEESGRTTSLVVLRSKRPDSKPRTYLCTLVSKGCDIKTNQPDAGDWSNVERWEIHIPSRNGKDGKEHHKLIEINENGVLMGECERFMVGHELGHLVLHRDGLRKFGKEGHNFISTSVFKKDGPEEKEADEFSRKLSNLRDEHLAKNWPNVRDRLNRLNRK
ncbi:hypothetical protein FACS1894139_17720 [Planctomycetales bacterium]|nr:hypothetical protein FACS1894107_14840 [Planctomycetales bacterium]GHT00842.1 hypothetical protein FACS1894108_13860 [Planctomycetales bacterium]GHT08252.1 hypothetical protein FACS1894139_17720 [Planctomycetales bacterium]